MLGGAGMPTLSHYTSLTDSRFLAVMKKLGYGEQYRYAHDYPGNFVRQQFRPDAIASTRFWNPGANPSEDVMRQRHESRWGKE